MPSPASRVSTAGSASTTTPRWRGFCSARRRWRPFPGKRSVRRGISGSPTPSPSIGSARGWTGSAAASVEGDREKARVDVVMRSGRRGLGRAGLLCAALAALAAHPSALLAATGNVVMGEILGPIHGITSEYVARAVAHADEEGAALLVITIDTPGGMVSSTKEIIQSILSSRTPVVLFVAPSGAGAASAGFYITLSADVAAMSPGTQI